jgi:acyl-coenzyme A synthetase/AMP-(fatty) acid ligase
MIVDFLLNIFQGNKSREAIIWRDQVFHYDWLLDRISQWRGIISEQAILPGTVTALEADFSPNGVALFLAMAEHRCILIPLTNSVEAKKHEFMEIAEVELSIRLDDEDNMTLRQSGHPGLVLFSSGSTGKSKAAVHDLTNLLDKYKAPRKRRRAISFLLYDHIGGVNTMLYLLSTGGCVITVRDRTPEGVLRAVEKYGAELLPTSPTFINLILLSEAHKNHDLSSLKTVTYGTEPMPESTLKRFHKLFPQITLQQTYGLSEVGIPGSKSQSSDSLWVKIGGNGFETRVVDGILQIRAQSAMMGYLNAPNPFTDDGWFITGDMVEFDGEYYRILGRKSDIINVGGEKVYPAEIESILLGMPQVLEAVVTGEPNAIVGSIVKATIVLSGKEQLSDFRVRLNKYMQEKGVQTFKIPQKVILRKGDLHTSRFKKIRSV